ncbi:MAG: YihY/virulence factor BrkB family protein, partial [Acidimicrobiales bacterium]
MGLNDGTGPVGTFEREAETVLRRWYSLGGRVIRSAAKDRVTTSAASLAFHWFLAIFPGALALLGLAHLVGLTSAQLRSLVHDLDVVLPAAASQVLIEALRSPLSHTANLFELALGTVVALWAGVESMAALQVGLDIANDVQRDRGLVKRRLVALPLLGLTVLLGVSAFALLVLGAPLGRLLSISVPGAGPAVATVWNIARFSGAFVLISILMSAYYAIGPWKQHQTWRWVTPGSLTATLGWLVTSWAYSLYLDDV